MKPEDQRIAFLQHLGWTDLNRSSKLGGYRALRGTNPSGVKNQIAPNPCVDLNIIHEAEKLLTHDERFRITLMLEELTNSGHFWAVTEAECLSLAVFATAQQRLEAFLKTLNLYKE